MTDLNIRPEDIASVLKKHLQDFKPTTHVEEIGRVIETGDGIARVSGLPNVMANELLEFPHGLVGLAFNLEEDNVGCVILGEASDLQEGDAVRQTGRI